MKYQILFSRKAKENSISVSSAELVMVNMVAIL